MKTELEDNVVQLSDHRLGLHGKEPPEGEGKNWLGRMKHGTRFLAMKKSDHGSIVGDFVVLTDPATMPVVLLGENSLDGKGNNIKPQWRDPEKFSADYRWYITLEVVEQNHGNINPVHTEPVASDGKSKVIDKVHEKK